MRRIIVLSVIAVVLSYTDLYAKEAISGNVGWLHTSNSNYGDSGVVNLRGEHQLSGDLWLGAEGGYHGRQSHDPYGDISGYSLLGEVIYYVPLNWSARPYVLGGLGWSWWQFDRSVDIQDKGIEIELGDSLAKKVAIGALWPLRDNWSMAIEWAYFQSDVPKDSHYEDGSFANVLGDDDRSGKVTIGQEELTVTIGLRKEF